MVLYYNTLEVAAVGVHKDLEVTVEKLTEAGGHKNLNVSVDKSYHIYQLVHPRK